MDAIDDKFNCDKIDSILFTCRFKRNDLEPQCDNCAIGKQESILRKG